MTTQPRRVLVVDDLADWRTTLRGVLADKGYHVDVAASSEQALQTLESAAYDVALIDMRLEDGDEDNKEGLALARKIRIRWPKVRIVIVTGYGVTDDIRQAREPDAAGQILAEEFVPKSDIASLLKTVQRLLP